MKKLICATIMIISLSACSTSTPVILYPELPDSITSPCVIPKASIDTNGDLLNYTVELKGDLSECATKQKALADSIKQTNDQIKSKKSS